MSIATYIDHTILKPDTTIADIETLCMEAMMFGFAAVCVPPYYVADAKRRLMGGPVKVVTVAGFPFGYGNTSAKLNEIHDAITSGADEIDVVQNLAAVKSKNIAYATAEIKECVQTLHSAGKVIKVILETGLLTDTQIKACCKAYGALNVDYVKTSTGYAGEGATVHAVQLMRRSLPEHVIIKASGGIRTFEFAKELIAAGANRIGCSGSVQIVHAEGLLKSKNK